MRRTHFHQLIAVLCIALVILNDHLRLHAPNVFVTLYSSYSSVTNWTDQFNETVGPNLATGTISDKTSVNLTSTTITGSGTYNWNSRGYSFPSTATVSAGNNASTLNTLTPGLGVAFSDPANWVLTPSLQLTTPGLNALNVATVGMGSLSPPSLLNTRTPVPTFTSLTNLREVQFARPAPFGGWLVSGQVVGMLNWPTSYMPVTLTMQLQNLFTGVPAKAMQDVLTHLDNVMASGPVTLYGEPVFYNEAGRVGVSVSMNFLAQLGVYQDYVAGELDILTAALSQRYLNDAGLGWLVNTNSTAFRAGQYVGMVINVILQFTPLAPFVDAIQAQGHLENAEEAYLNGDNYTAALEAVNAVGAISRALPVCNIGGVTAMVARGVSLVNGVANVVSAVNAVQNGDTLSAILNIGFATLNFYAAFRACFPGEFCRMVDGGFVRLDQSHDDDSIDTCVDTNPRGKVVPGHIRQMHIAWANIWHLEANGKTLRTTALHPFFVWGKGWVRCWKLEPGDELRSHNGVRVFVERVYDSGVAEQVYGCTVDEHHTYFVGKPDWGFSIWAHNGCESQSRNKDGTWAPKEPGQESPGRSFEDAALKKAGLAKNKSTTIKSKTNDGTPRGTKPDAIDPESGSLVEVKSGETVSMTPQMQAQVNAAIKLGVSNKLIVAPETTVYKSVIKAVGYDNIQVYNPQTGELSPFPRPV